MPNRKPGPSQASLGYLELIVLLDGLDGQGDYTSFPEKCELRNQLKQIRSGTTVE
jgi:hypothetical protein